MPGTAHKVVSVLLRLTEFASAVIVLGMLGHFCYCLGIADAHADDRIIYTMVTAGIAVMYSICFCPPFASLFLGFPFDFILWIMWLVAFCLLETKTASGTCSSRWYYDYWGYYWGHFWRVGPIGRVDINRAGCPQWRTVLAFSFIASFLHLTSAFLGIYVCQTYVHFKSTVKDIKNQAEKLKKPATRPDMVYQQNPQVENGNGVTQPKDS